jgi:plastocyanin
MLSPYARPRYRPPVRAEATSTSPEAAVVYLRGPTVAPAARAGVARIVQRNRTILPHVTAVQVGTRVEFPNDDDVFHNLFSLSAAHRFNLGRYPPGESRSELFERAGVVRLFCDIHSEMGGVILVLDTPYFTSPEADGRFRIAGVPPGEYTAIVWHELAGTDSTRVVVRDGAETTVDFVLGR